MITTELSLSRCPAGLLQIVGGGFFPRGGIDTATSGPAGGAADVVSAIVNGVADTDGFGVGLFLANFAFFGVGVGFAPGLPFFPTWTIARVSTAFAGSTRIS